MLWLLPAAITDVDDDYDDDDDDDDEARNNALDAAPAGDGRGSGTRRNNATIKRSTSNRTDEHNKPNECAQPVCFQHDNVRLFSFSLPLYSRYDACEKGKERERERERDMKNRGHQTNKHGRRSGYFLRQQFLFFLLNEHINNVDKIHSALFFIQGLCDRYPTEIEVSISMSNDVVVVAIDDDNKPCFNYSCSSNYQHSKQLMMK